MLNRTTASLFLISLFTRIVLADISAFSGTACDGDVGADVACDGSCHSFSGRHSFEASFGGTSIELLNFGQPLTDTVNFLKVTPSILHCVTTFQNAGCDTLVGVFQSQGNGECVHVNTGTSVQSFRCAPDNICVS